MYIVLVVTLCATAAPTLLVSNVFLLNIFEVFSATNVVCEYVSHTVLLIVSLTNSPYW